MSPFPSSLNPSIHQRINPIHPSNRRLRLKCRSTSKQLDLRTCLIYHDTTDFFTCPPFRTLFSPFSLRPSQSVSSSPAAADCTNTGKTTRLAAWRSSIFCWPAAVTAPKNPRTRLGSRVKCHSEHFHTIDPPIPLPSASTNARSHTCAQHPGCRREKATTRRLEPQKEPFVSFRPLVLRLAPLSLSPVPHTPCLFIQGSLPIHLLGPLITYYQHTTTARKRP